MYAYVWASKDPGALSFNTQPMSRTAATEYAVRLVEGGRRLVRIYRAACGPNFLTDDVLLELRRGSGR